MIGLSQRWDVNKRRDEAELLAHLVEQAALGPGARREIVARAAGLVEEIRAASSPGMMDVFLAEYGLSTEEGVALMCLAEALLRVPDADTIDALIEDKIAPSDWSSHVGQSSSPLVNASTWGLLFTGKVLDDAEPGVAGRLRAMVRRLGEPVIRAAVARAMREMGRQFVLGQTIDEAMKRASEKEARGYTYSYDMLGEAAMTAGDAAGYADAYRAAITAIATAATHDNIAENPGISVKLSALHPRYEVAQAERVMAELVPILSDLAHRAARARIGLNVDAEEADRLGLSLAVIERVLEDPKLAGWDGFGVVVQAYGRRAGDVIEGLHELATRLDRRIMVRLVKGAYWDTEIKHAQVEGLADFPVFTRKVATDVSYLAHARRLLQLTDWIYPQFATHNAHTVAAILHMAGDLGPDMYEFQRLHGMGKALHEIVHGAEKTRCRIYAPIGAHRDLLAYLVRRLLENGANSSFVNQIVDEEMPAVEVAACPFEALNAAPGPFEPVITRAPDLFAPERPNSVGFDLNDVTTLAVIEAARQKPVALEVAPILAAGSHGGALEPICNPATGATLGRVRLAGAEDVAAAIGAARVWEASPAVRAEILNRAADFYERDFGEAFALLASEAGKTLADAVAELREAVDFMRYYAAQAEQPAPARGIFTCISPWNFPLAIFFGQITAALAAGNAVLAKPAETTPAIAAFGIARLHEAGVPKTALQLLPGHGGDIGRALTSDPRICGTAFTGSTATARRIQAAMAENCAPGTPLIAETGGLNVMIVDSTALPEQAVRDIVASAFQSAGQRCSALRCLYVQEDIAESLTRMLIGAMDELKLGDPWRLDTDIGPVITADAAGEINAYVDAAQAQGRVLHRLITPKSGHFVAPALLSVGGIEDLSHEVFGPVLHLATFKAGEMEAVIAAVNARGYGLTFGLHTRIDSRVQQVADAVHAGNIYANRNQIGAIVGSQPFGGEGLSGTGPKAGGPHYVRRFVGVAQSVQGGDDPAVELALLCAALEAAQPVRVASQNLPGPTGELNRLSTWTRPPILCLGPGDAARARQMRAVEALGGVALAVPGRVSPEELTHLPEFGGAIWWGDAVQGRAFALALARREGAILPLITGSPDAAHALLERHLCVDTTAAGGNAGLLAGEG